MTAPTAGAAPAAGSYDAVRGAPGDGRAGNGPPGDGRAGAGRPGAGRADALLLPALRETGAVHVWQGRAPDLLDPADLAVLSAEERHQLRTRVPGTAVHYAGAHAAARRVLARHLGVAPADIGLGRNPCPRCDDPVHGRPRVVTPPGDVEFSLSRSGPYWMLAVAAGRQVGVDIEDAGVFGALGPAMPFVMTGAELDHLERQPDEESRRREFFRCWTRKEAVLKASGVGIVADLTTVEVLPGPGPSAVVRHSEGSGPGSWTVQDVPAPAGLTAALAREAGRTGPVILHRPHAFA